MTTSLSRGTVISMFFRLCSRAPLTCMKSCGIRGCPSRPSIRHNFSTHGRNRPTRPRENWVLRNPMDCTGVWYHQPCSPFLNGTSWNSVDFVSQPTIGSYQASPASDRWHCLGSSYNWQTGIWRGNCLVRERYSSGWCTCCRCQVAPVERQPEIGDEPGQAGGQHPPRRRCPRHHRREFRRLTLSHRASGTGDRGSHDLGRGACSRLRVRPRRHQHAAQRRHLGPRRGRGHWLRLHPRQCPLRRDGHRRGHRGGRGPRDHPASPLAQRRRADPGRCAGEARRAHGPVGLGAGGPRDHSPSLGRRSDRIGSGHRTTHQQLRRVGGAQGRSRRVPLGGQRA